VFNALVERLLGEVNHVFADRVLELLTDAGLDSADAARRPTC